MESGWKAGISGINKTCQTLVLQPSCCHLTAMAPRSSTSLLITMLTMLAVSVVLLPLLLASPLPSTARPLTPESATPAAASAAAPQDPLPERLPVPMACGTHAVYVPPPTDLDAPTIGPTSEEPGFPLDIF